ncbi:sialate O-acetylesterase [Gaetbulibacter sp. M240]|uniref:sialate O-acetylesterase n=1 Tax=Gaetbulibacter sp. M240 TaxID=3126511 RepID=UPI00374EFB2E
MQILKFKALSFLFIIFQIWFGYTQTKLPNFFSNNMVFQQQENVPIWGTDLPGTSVNILSSWGESKLVETDQNGNWNTTLKTPKASFNSEEISISGTSKITLHNVLIGEVWFCSGQSNMEMPMKGNKNQPIWGGPELIATSKNQHIRLFNTERASSLSLETNVVGEWEEARPETVKAFSAIGYMYGKELFEKLNVPIGIIESSWGGTPIECWLPKEIVETYENITIPDSLPQDINKRKRPSCLFNAMIYPFKDFKIKGFLWYQGEGNRKIAHRYKKSMHDLVNNWRSQWKGDNLPFYFVQIAPFGYFEKGRSLLIAANELREAQLFAAQEISNSGIVVTTDVGHCDNIHPPEKRVVANRLTRWALANQYGFDKLPFRSPEFKKMEIKGNKAQIHFEFFGPNKANLKLDKTRSLQNFEVAGADQNFYPAKAQINSDQTITVFSPEVQVPTAVRYGFVDCLEGSLFSKAGLPVSPFRTDNWKK